MSLNEEVINNIYKNAHIALQSISDLKPEADCEDMNQELSREYDEYEKIIGEISKYMSEKDIEPKDISMMKKAMLWTSVKMNAASDDSRSHLAEMMIKGTVMGICELRQIITRSPKEVDGEIIELANRLLQLEEDCERRLKDML